MLVSFSKRLSILMSNMQPMVFGFVAYDVTLLAMTAPTDSLMTDRMAEWQRLAC